MKPIYDPQFIQNYKQAEPALVNAIKDHLPGEFSDWEEENTSWNGTTKTVHNSGSNPRASACAFRIYVANILPEEKLGYINFLQNKQELEKLKAGMTAVVEALSSLSFFTLVEFDRSASESLSLERRLSGVHLGSVAAMLRLLDPSVQVGVVAAQNELDKIGDPNQKTDFRAAAVVQACREVYEARTFSLAPRSALKEPAKKGDDPKPALFYQFAKSVFDVLGITTDPASALKRLKKLHADAPNTSSSSK